MVPKEGPGSNDERKMVSNTTLLLDTRTAGSFERVVEQCREEFAEFGETRLVKATLAYKELLYSLQAILPQSPRSPHQELTASWGRRVAGRNSNRSTSVDIQHPFLRHVTEQIEGLQRCHDMNVEGLERQLAQIRKQVRSLDEENKIRRQLELRWRVEAAIDSVKCVRLFCTVNYIALQRVLEEFDKIMGSAVTEIIMLGVVETRRFAKDCHLFEGGGAAEIQEELEELSNQFAMAEACSSRIGTVVRKLLSKISKPRNSPSRRLKKISKLEALEQLAVC
mmetsp:Transcript_14024/g.21828  ORF Transcript_14024/g.21828 Transcript_14024/m.21828 type:complete len:280 (-) Transcript_14024:81-920(-)